MMTVSLPLTQYMYLRLHLIHLAWSRGITVFGGCEGGILPARRSGPVKNRADEARGEPSGFTESL